jgi:CPA2 family monovalent cation:H+ antiporter-2
MPDTGLLVNLALVVIAAAIGGAIAVRLGQSAILGYVVAGVLVGSYTPGPTGDPETVAALADLGLVFLLFAVGLQLSLRELLGVGRVALVGGTAQVIILILAGTAVAGVLGFAPVESVFFGAFVALSSTTVLAKVLGDRGETDAMHGTLAMAWATVQDLLTIVLVVLLTGIAGAHGESGDLVFALAKALAFMAIVLPIGLIGLPWLLHHASLLRNREIFVLVVVGAAVGTAYVSEQFGLSLALGAFVAGLMVSESEVSYQALGELAPLRDLFAALFFVFIGMLVDPIFVLGALPLLAAALLLLVPLKAAVIAGLARLFGMPLRVAVLAGVALAQAGEFSFLLARVGVSAGAVGAQMFSLMLAAAAASIVVSPGLLRLAPATLRSIEARLPPPTVAELEAGTVPLPRRHVVLCGYGRVGRLIGAALARRGFEYLVLDIDPRICTALRRGGIRVVQGSAENPHNLARAGLERADVLVVTLPDPIAIRQVVDHARRHHPRLPIIARARTAADRQFLLAQGVSEIVMPETEAALEMARYTLARLGVSAVETRAIVQGLRRRSGGARERG